MSRPDWMDCGDNDGYNVVLHNNGMLRFVPFEGTSIYCKISLARMDSKDGNLIEVTF